MTVFGRDTILVCNNVTKATRSTQPCIPLKSPNRVPGLIGWDKCRNAGGR